MQQLKFNGMAASYNEQLQLPIHQQLEAHQLIAQLMQAELLARNNERTAYYLRLAKLRLYKETSRCSDSNAMTVNNLRPQ